MRLVIVDYGMGNIRSIISSLNYIGVSDVAVSSNYDILKASDKLILPGVGSFGKAMNRIKERNLDAYLHEFVIDYKKPILGICLGMQLMGKSSNEDGDNDGLGFVENSVRKFETTTFKIPHVGFNQVMVTEDSRLYSGLNANPDFYFTHSYRMMGEANINPSFCDYSEKFIASFEKDNIAGVQFHPELSQRNGLNLLKNFIDKF
ncbi:imidazole glycerol phosphate synthase subunit HisH [Pedobacter panaciterrae]|uniref:imidazole glycerol phosphate synthase subunit HisH n=1 Tax=Pedobacter panaciterrae TaxID=363849 RepID=UPI00155DB679|nr:imidazole glycerol phosphate synthase subunit HisH [Pedobacter panaciterrae]NQX55248.1 imidazole glycerol phosphate synthase subunit HisH [Pedobacter panaciterrae]